MTTYTFGTNAVPGDFIEIPDPSNAGQTKRPAAGFVLKVRNAATLAALSDVSTGLYGYWNTTTTDIPEIQVSTDGGTTWHPSMQGVEALSSALTTAAALTAHSSRVDNPHAVTQSQVGLGNVNNTTDAGKPVSTAQAAVNATLQKKIQTFASTSAAQAAVTGGTLVNGDIFFTLGP
jgi:hypothetical protein